MELKYYEYYNTIGSWNNKEQIRSYKTEKRYLHIAYYRAFEF